MNTQTTCNHPLSLQGTKHELVMQDAPQECWTPENIELAFRFCPLCGEDIQPTVIGKMICSGKFMTPEPNTNQMNETILTEPTPGTPAATYLSNIRLRGVDVKSMSYVATSSGPAWTFILKAPGCEEDQLPVAEISSGGHALFRRGRGDRRIYTPHQMDGLVHETMAAVAPPPRMQTVGQSNHDGHPGLVIRDSETGIEYFWCHGAMVRLR